MATVTEILPPPTEKFYNIKVSEKELNKMKIVINYFLDHSKYNSINIKNLYKDLCLVGEPK